MALTAKSVSKPFSLGLQRQPNGVSITQAGSIVTSDASGSANTSPLSVSEYSSAITTLTVPDNALNLVLSTSNAALRIGEDSGLSTYYTLPANAANYKIPVAGMGLIYMGGDAGTVTVQFYFEIA